MKKIKIILCSIILIIVCLCSFEYYRFNVNSQMDEFIGIDTTVDYIYNTKNIKIAYFYDDLGDGLENNRVLIILSNTKKFDNTSGVFRCRIGLYTENNELVCFKDYRFSLYGPTKSEAECNVGYDKILRSLTLRDGYYVRLLIPCEDENIDIKIPCKPDKKVVREKRMKKLKNKVKFDI